MRTKESRKQIRGALVAILLTLIGCGGGDSGTKAIQNVVVVADPNAPVQASSSELFIEISGDFNHSSDEAFELSVTLAGSLAADATLSLEDSPNFLTLSSDNQKISADYSVAGIHTVTVTAQSGNKFTSSSFDLSIDATLNGRYEGLTDPDKVRYTALITRSQRIFWSAIVDGQTRINLHCQGRFAMTITEASGGGHCKRKEDGNASVLAADFDLSLDDDGVSLVIRYGDTAGALVSTDSIGAMTRLDRSYLANDADITGFYVSTQLGSVRWLSIDSDGVVRDTTADGFERFRCRIDALISPFDFSKVRVNYDGSIQGINGTWSNCDLTDQAGLRVLVGDASGQNDGAVRFYDVGPDRYLDAYLAREYPVYSDPVSRMNYVRVCSQGLPTAIASQYNVDDNVCDAL